MTIASIDIGTNTVILLIAEVNTVTKSIVPVFNDYNMPRIGRGIKQNGKISSESISNLLAVLRKYKSIINKFNCGRIIVSGTNVFRIASNSSEIIETIRKECGMELIVIDGNEEAEYAYLGATSALKTIGRTTVIDIGGSSTEIITGDTTKILSKVSLQLGSVTATEEFLKSSPPTINEIESLNSAATNHFRTYNNSLVSSQIIAVAGTATTLACMHLGLKEFDEDLVDNFTLKKDDLIHMISEISKLDSTGILNKYGTIMQGREDIIMAGTIILEQFLKYYKIENVSVSTRGIRYGAIVKNIFYKTTD